MDFTKKTLDIHNQGTGERLACVTLEETETCELHLLIDQEVIEFFTNRGTSYGAVETEENVLGGNLLVKSRFRWMRSHTTDSKCKRISFSEKLRYTETQKT